MSGAMRRINEPVPADVMLGSDGMPECVWWRGRSERVELIRDTWYVDDMWWAERPVQRVYHEVQLEHGARLVLSWDLIKQRWQAQR
jgi:hypothetical protein